MTAHSDMALLAAASYKDLRESRGNQCPVLTGWTELTQSTMSGAGSDSTPLCAGYGGAR